MNSKMMYIIEHLEPRLWKWCLLEYVHISKVVSRDNLIFTNIRQKDTAKLKGLGTVYKESIRQLNFKNMCILDPEAEKTLSNKDKFDFLVFGGILGDEPMQKRTERELSTRIDAETRNLGKKQLSTDTAVFVAKHVVEGGSMADLEFKDEIEIPIRDGESVILPFRYVLINKKPLLPKGLVEFLKKRKGF